MIYNVLILIVFFSGLIYFLFNIVSCLKKGNRTEIESLNLKYNVLAFIVLLIGIISRIERLWF